MAPWLRYLLALIVFAHGFVYLGPGSPIRAFTAWTGHSWLLRGGLTGEPLRSFAWILHILAGIATLACAATIAFPSMLPGWWRPLAIGSGVTGLLAFSVFWDGRPQFLFHHGAIGTVLSATLLLAALAFPHSFD